MKQYTTEANHADNARPTSTDGIIFHGVVDVTVTCTCGDWITVEVTAYDAGSDYEELKDIAYDEAGFTETGACCSCALSSAQEDLADSDMRDWKANMEGSDTPIGERASMLT